MVKAKHQSKKAASLLITFLIASGIAATCFAILMIVSAYKSDIAGRIEDLRNTVLNTMRLIRLW